MPPERAHPPAGPGQSKPVSSRQQGPHPRLQAVLQRHLRSAWRQPPHQPTVQAFAATRALLAADELRSLVLDSGCGTGASSYAIAQRHPGQVVLGVDRSATRLARSRPGPWPQRDGNVLLVRAELATFWRLALAAGWQLQAHYLLYPNPWPKSGQLLRRWHAHPVFPTLLALGGDLQLRCNWAVYAREFALATGWMTGQDLQPEPLADAEGLSPFETKYRDSGHALYRLRADLSVHAGRQRLLL